MYKPNFRRKRSGVPVLSRADIDNIGEKLIADFCPEALKEPMAIDIDSLAQDYLGLYQDFQYLSHNGIYLGMMIFNDTNKVPIYDPSANCASYIRAKAGTIMIDNGLLDDSQEKRYRFTMGHEVAHAFLHSDYYGSHPNQTTLFADESIPLVQCRIDQSLLQKKRKAAWTDYDWMEWQANRFSSAIFMPVSMIRKLVPYSSEQFLYPAACWVRDVYKTFNVSILAAEIRLRELGLIYDISHSDLVSEYHAIKW